MKLGVFFPDESSFYEKMGAEIFENYPAVQRLYEKAKKTARLDMKKSLIYAQTETAWDDTSKRIAVLLTSVAFYQTWYACYRVKPEVLLGNGVGLLSALVCAGTLTLADAVRMVRKREWKLPPFVKPDGTVLSCSCGKPLADAAALQTELHWCRDERAETEELLHYAADFGVDCLLEIGPNDCYTRAFQKAAPEAKTVFAYLDTANDNGYILESFEYRKHFNNLYAAKRMLGIAACTQNYNDGTECDERIMVAYNALHAYLDEVRRKRQTGAEPIVSDFDLQLCIDQLKQILREKKTPHAEVWQRVLMLQNETAMELQHCFAEWFSPVQTNT